jgi:hypothetical protein
MTMITVNGNIILIHSTFASRVLRKLPSYYKETGFTA